MNVTVLVTNWCSAPANMIRPSLHITMAAHNMYSPTSITRVLTNTIRLISLPIWCGVLTSLPLLPSRHHQPGISLCVLPFHTLCQANLILFPYFVKNAIKENIKFVQSDQNGAIWHLEVDILNWNWSWIRLNFIVHCNFQPNKGDIEASSAW